MSASSSSSSSEEGESSSTLQQPRSRKRQSAVTFSSMPPQHTNPSPRTDDNDGENDQKNKISLFGKFGARAKQQNGSTNGTMNKSIKNTGKKRRAFKRHTSKVFLPRLVHRNQPFHQCESRMWVFKKNAHLSWKLIIGDWFHLLLRVPTHYSVVLLILIWTLGILFFALIYTAVDKTNGPDIDCGLSGKNDSIGFSGAFAFAMETATTTGYGLPGSSNAFFEDDCGKVQAVIYFQMVFNMLFNAFMFAFFYSQLSKSEYRSIQLVYSTKLVVRKRKEDGRIIASVRCYDLDSSHPLVEAHARMYLSDHKLKLLPLRLSDPDDSQGAMLQPSIPQEIVHEIDPHSPLSPRKPLPFVVSQTSKASPSVLTHRSTVSSSRLSSIPLRSIDSRTGNRNEIACPICGDSFPTYDLWKAHVAYAGQIEEHEGTNFEPSHRSFEVPNIEPISVEEVREHLEHKLSEIVVVVEAIDPQLSGTFQSLQSYKYEDIAFGANFEDCLSVDIANNNIAVDMELFHTIAVEDSDEDEDFSYE